MSDNAELGHEPFDFGVTLDGVHHESIRCRACTQAWPCLTVRHVEALAERDAALAAVADLRVIAGEMASELEAIEERNPEMSRGAGVLDAWRALGVGKGE